MIIFAYILPTFKVERKQNTKQTAEAIFIGYNIKKLYVLAIKSWIFV